MITLLILNIWLQLGLGCSDSLPEIYCKSEFDGLSLTAYCLAEDARLLSRQNSEGFKTKIKELGGWNASEKFCEFSIDEKKESYSIEKFENLVYLVPATYTDWPSMQKELIEAYQQDGDYKYFRELHISDSTLRADLIIQQVEFDISKRQLSDTGILIQVAERNFRDDFYSQFRMFLRDKKY